MPWKCFVAGVTLACALSGTAARAAEPVWPSDQEAELTRVEAELRDCQRRRFAALFSNDESRVKELSERFKELQKERRELLEAIDKI
jgi:hypothetical protein